MSQLKLCISPVLQAHTCSPTNCLNNTLSQPTNQMKILFAAVKMANLKKSGKCLARTLGCVAWKRYILLSTFLEQTQILLLTRPTSAGIAPQYELAPTLLIAFRYNHAFEEHVNLCSKRHHTSAKQQDYYCCLPIMYVNFIYRKRKKVKLSRNRPWRPTGLWDVKDPTLSRQSAHS
jgi:hypothetical protein